MSGGVLPRLLAKYASPAAWATVVLFAVDSVTNVIDYGFHVFLGRRLPPGDFAMVQTVNSALLIVITAFGVTQPVVARYVAAAAAARADQGASGAAVFRYAMRHAVWLGIVLSLLAWMARVPLAGWLNVPPLAVGLVIAVVPLSLLRPLVAGVLQGQGRTMAFGLTRTFNAAGRLAVAVAAVGLGAGALGALTALSIGSLLALIGGLLFLGRAVWQRAPAVPAGAADNGGRLILMALVGYVAYMSLLNNDLIWVNRVFEPLTAGSYATAVLLRRVLLLMPGAAIVVMYPRAVARVALHQSPDGLIWKTAAVVSASTFSLTLLYFAQGPLIVRLAFGTPYAQAAPLLGWMGIAMVGYGLGSLWLNLYLATRPLPFVVLLVVVALAQHAGLGAFHQTLAQVVGVFLITGWLTALGGLLIYVFMLRPRLSRPRSREAPAPEVVP